MTRIGNTFYVSVSMFFDVGFSFGCFHTIFTFPHISRVNTYIVLHNCGLYQSGFNGLESNHSQQEFVYEFLSE